LSCTLQIVFATVFSALIKNFRSDVSDTTQNYMRPNSLALRRHYIKKYYVAIY